MIVSVLSISTSPLLCFGSMPCLLKCSNQPWHWGEEHMMHERLNSHHMFQRVNHRHLHTINSSTQGIFRVSDQPNLHVFKENLLRQGQNIQTSHRIKSFIFLWLFFLLCGNCVNHYTRETPLKCMPKSCCAWFSNFSILLYNHTFPQYASAFQ